MKQNKTIPLVIAIIIILATIVGWAWHKDNWWLLLGIPFASFFFGNGHGVGRSLEYVLTLVFGHIIYTLVIGNFQFTVWSWFFFLCGLMSYGAVSIILGTEKSNWEKQSKLDCDNRTFKEYLKEKYS